MNRKFCFSRFLVLAVAFALFIGAATVSAETWKFGVMGDTQWTTT